MHPLLIAGAYSLGAYLVDVPLRRRNAAALAQAYATAKGKPVLNIGCGTPGTSFQGACFDGDVNVDINGRRDVPHGTPGVVTYADAQDLSDFETGEFGAVIASHIMEHLPRPDVALHEWLRVTNFDPKALFIVTPSWWAPHTWLHPGHLFWFTDGAGGTKGGKAIRLREEPGQLASRILMLR